MPSLIRLLTHPETRRPGPEPLRVDLRRILLAGIGVWALALVVTLVVMAMTREGWVAVAVCLAGVALGGVGLLWERAHR